MRGNPIGIFDSGIGGLTVVKHLQRLLPNENLVYFGDTARVPYGTRSDKLIKQYALEDAAFLQQFDIKMLVIACNTASAVAVDLLKKSLDIPVTGVIIPGVEAAIRSTKTNKIGVIGTSATIGSRAYHTRIKQRAPQVRVFGQPCPLLIPLVEEGWIEGEVTRLAIRHYLSPLLENDIDTLILGCTHFPVLSEAIASVTGPSVRLIDSGEEAALITRKILQELDLSNADNNSPQTQFYVSDIPQKFDEVGTRFLGKPVVNAGRVDFDAFLMEIGEKIYEPLNK